LLAVNEGAEKEDQGSRKAASKYAGGKNGENLRYRFQSVSPSDPISVEKQLDIIVNMLIEGN